MEKGGKTYTEAGDLCEYMREMCNKLCVFIGVG